MSRCGARSAARHRPQHSKQGKQARQPKPHSPCCRRGGSCSAGGSRPAGFCPNRGTAACREEVPASCRPPNGCCCCCCCCCCASSGSTGAGRGGCRPSEIRRLSCGPKASPPGRLAGSPDAGSVNVSVLAAAPASLLTSDGRRMAGPSSAHASPSLSGPSSPPSSSSVFASISARRRRALCLSSCGTSEQEDRAGAGAGHVCARGGWRGMVFAPAGASSRPRRRSAALRITQTQAHFSPP